MEASEPTRICLLRHGQTAWNAHQRIQGHTDIALDATGRWQAERLADALADEGLQALYSSDLQRACQTAAPLAARTGLALQTEAGLRERSFGSFEGLLYAEIESRWPADAQRWRRRDPDFEPGGGEALTTFSARCVRTVQALAARHTGQAIAIVAHGGVLDCIHREATHAGLQAARSWQLDNATINRLLWSPQGLVIVGWNDARHLEGGPAAT